MGMGMGMGIGLGAGGQADLGGALGSRLGYDNGASHDALGIYAHQGLHRLSEPPQATAAPFAVHRQSHHSSVMEQVSALYKENQRLRKQNQALLAASDTRQRAVVKLLRETVSAGGERKEDTTDLSEDQRKRQLMQLLLALLDASPEQDDDAEKRREESTLQELKEPSALATTETQFSSVDATAANPKIINVSKGNNTRNNTSNSSAGHSSGLSNNQSSHSPRIQTTDTRRATNQRNSMSFEPTPPCETRDSRLSGKKHRDWNTDSLLEISSQGCVADSEIKGDDYAKETRKAIGTHQHSASTRRKMSLGRRRSSLMSSTYSANSPEI
ncbi:hypothetical protein J3B02_006145, partial [Coemansia erecta]